MRLGHAKVGTQDGEVIAEQLPILVFRWFLLQLSLKERPCSIFQQGILLYTHILHVFAHNLLRLS